MTVLVEACVDSVASAAAAQRGGAERLELCDNLFDGGTTPSAGMIEAVKARVTLPMFVIVRPRGGGFVYSADEFDVMRREVAIAAQFGADGVVLGVLTSEARIDIQRTRELVRIAGDMPVTFHRAFDLTRDVEEALEMVIDAGVTRVLTSGGMPTALEGVDTIRKLVARARDRVEIMAGGSVREDNVAELIQRSGVHEVHVRGTVLETTTMQPVNRSVRLRKALPEDEGAWETTDERRVREIVRLANGAP